MEHSAHAEGTRSGDEKPHCDAYEQRRHHQTCVRPSTQVTKSPQKTSVHNVHASGHEKAILCARQRSCSYHSTGRFVFKSLKKSSREIGMQERIHGNTRKAPHNAFTFDIKHATTFIVNYAEEHAIQLPGRIPGYKRTDLQLLPCSTTKRSVWIQYSAVAAQVHLRSFSYRSFCRIWKELLPNILPTRPLTDLCAVCHQNARLITRSSNLPEEEKSKVMDNCCTTSLS